MHEFPHMKKFFWGHHMWARGYFCCSSGNVTDEIIAEYIANQNEDRVDDFRVDGVYFLKPAWCGNQPAGLWPEQDLQSVTEATSFSR